MFWLSWKFRLMNSVSGWHVWTVKMIDIDKIKDLQLGPTFKKTMIETGLVPFVPVLLFSFSFHLFFPFLTRIYFTFWKHQAILSLYVCVFLFLCFLSVFICFCELFICGSFSFFCLCLCLCFNLSFFLSFIFLSLRMNPCIMFYADMKAK